MASDAFGPLTRVMGDARFPRSHGERAVVPRPGGPGRGASGGSILILSYLVLSAVSLWSVAGFQRSTIEVRSAERYIETLQAFYLAESGAEDGYRWMRGQGSPPAGIVPFDPFNGPKSMGRGRYAVTVDPDDANPGRYLDLFVIRSTGQVNGVAVTRQVTRVLQAESFARYSYLTNSERLPPNTRIWFTGRDHFDGPVHSNDQLNISGSPIFDGPVTSAAGSVNYQRPAPTGGNNPRFNGGLSLGASPVQLPASVTQLRLAASAAGGAWFTGNTTIAFQSNGTMLVTNAARGWTNRAQPLPANGAMFVNGGNATVSGTLNGQVTIGTNRDVIVANNVTCADNPETNPQSDDILGLVSEQNIVISRSAPSALTIQASLMALRSSFTVENWWVGPPKGTLHVYGGILQESRGPVGTFNSATGQQLSGYSKDYRYDTRLSAMAPPFYPTTADYDEVLWQEH